MSYSSPPEESQRTSVLKSGAKRTVSLEQGLDGSMRVVKRFHAPGPALLGPVGSWFQRTLGDRRRAQGEARALRGARAAGLPVPRVLHCAVRNGSWELAMEAIEGARPLTEALTEVLEDARRSVPSSSPCGAFSHGGPHGGHRERERASARLDSAQFAPARLASELGALAGRVVAAGLLHPDPHPANVLVDGHGKAWLVDLARSRTGAPTRAVEASLVRALSRLRELTTATFRRRMARAFLQPGLRRAEVHRWARDLESRALKLRADELERRVSVWRRDSSATEIRTATGQRTVHVREHDGAPAPGWRTERLTEDTGQIWATLVRATLHGLPTAAPRALALDPPDWVEFDVPLVEGSPTEEARERLAAQLRLRGLDLAGEAPTVLCDPDGSALIGPRARLVRTAPARRAAYPRGAKP